MALSVGFRRFLSGFSRVPYAIRHESTSSTPLSTPKLFISVSFIMLGETLFDPEEDEFSVRLSRLTTDEKLRNAFSSFGQLLEAKVVTDRVSGRSKGFGFVRYATLEEAEKAREGMNAKFLDGWVIFVDPAKPREFKAQSTSQPESSNPGFRTNKTIGWCG